MGVRFIGSLEAMRNPAFRSPAFNEGGSGATTITAEELERQYAQPSYERPNDDVMTVDDSVRKSILGFVVLLFGAAIGAALFFIAPAAGLPVVIVAALVGIVLGFVNAFKREPSPALILVYALVQGVFVGAISFVFEAQLPGIVGQAVLATLCVVGVTLALFVSGKVRASKRATKIFLIAIIGYGLFSIVNLVLMLTGAVDDPWGLRGSVTLFGIPLGVILGLVAVLLGAYSLVLDFDYIKRGVENRAPRKYGWTAAFGILVTVIWLYVEILRLIAIARR